MEETADWLTHCTDLMNDKGRIAPATPGLLIRIIIRLWNLKQIVYMYLVKDK